MKLLRTYVVKSFMKRYFVCIFILPLLSGIVLLQEKYCGLWLSLTWSFFLSFSVKKAKLQGPPGNELFASCMKLLWFYNCLRLKEEKITHHSVNCHSDECFGAKMKCWNQTHAAAQFGMDWRDSVNWFTC